MLVNILALIAAIALSSVAAYFAVIGLTAIFAASFWPVVIMGSILEASKLVTASWVYRHRDIASGWLKGPLIAITIGLMILTSMGIFGFLSKAHIEQTSKHGENTIVIEQTEIAIASEKRFIDNAQRSLDQLDTVLEKSNAKDANYIRVRQRKEREQIATDIKASSDKIAKLQTDLVPLKKESVKAQAELGPIKYIADMIYGDKAAEHTDAAVRAVIIMLVAMFDPLAVLLIIAANVGFSRKQPPTKSWRSKKKRGIIEVDKNSMMNMK